MCFLQDKIEYMYLSVYLSVCACDYYSETAGDYVLNTLLVVLLVCLSFFLFVRAARGSSQIVAVGLDVCCPSLFSKTALPTFMILYIMLSYVSVWKPIKFDVNWSMLIKLIAKKT